MKSIKDQIKKPNKQVEKAGDSLPFILLYGGGSMDLIAPNYNTLENFQNAVEELVKQKKTIYPFLKI